MFKEQYWNERREWNQAIFHFWPSRTYTGVGKQSFGVKDTKSSTKRILSRRDLVDSSKNSKNYSLNEGNFFFIFYPKYSKKVKNSQKGTKNDLKMKVLKKKVLIFFAGNQFRKNKKKSFLVQIWVLNLFQKIVKNGQK